MLSNEAMYLWIFVGIPVFFFCSSSGVAANSAGECAVGQVPVEAAPVPEELREVVVVVHGAGLVTTAEMGVEGSGHLVFDFVSEPDEKAQVVRSVRVYRALVFI